MRTIGDRHTRGVESVLTRCVWVSVLESSTARGRRWMGRWGGRAGSCSRNVPPDSGRKAVEVQSSGTLALQRDDLRALDRRVDHVPPLLHHLLSLRQVLRPVVRTANFIALHVSQLSFDDVRREA